MAGETYGYYKNTQKNSNEKQNNRKKLTQALKTAIKMQMKNKNILSNSKMSQRELDIHQTQNKK